MMKNTLTKILSYVLVALLSCAITMTVMLSALNQQPAGYSKLDQLEDVINTYFIGDPDWEAVEDAAAGAMVESLGDRWSHYMTKDQYDSYMEQMTNSYVGVGITVQLHEEGGILVTKVTAGSPAEEAGVLAGDRIIAADGTDVTSMDLNGASQLIKGEAGSRVELTVIRAGETLKLSVERRVIKTAVAVATMLEGKIGLVRIVNFDERCADETIAAIEKLQKQGAEKLIFDVRFNPGGYAKELVKVLDYLLPEGDLFRTVNYAGQESLDRSDAACLKMPMAVLVNGDSYSAAEFFAAALREYDWATVVGTQTCGKGYFQSTFRLGDGSAVTISLGKYFTPKGVSLAEVGGLVPDVVVEVDEETAAAIYAETLDPMEDPQILAAIDALNKK